MLRVTPAIPTAHASVLQTSLSNHCMAGLLRGTEVKARNGLDLSLQSCECVGVSHCPILRIRNMKLKAPWQGQLAGITEVIREVFTS